MKQEENEKVADIISTLVVVNRGNFVIECGRELQELTEAVQGQRTKSGKIVITLEMVPSAWREDGSCYQVDLKPQVSITKPKKEHGKTLLFVTEDHKLTREDPGQEELFREELERETNGRR